MHKTHENVCRTLIHSSSRPPPPLLLILLQWTLNRVLYALKRALHTIDASYIFCACLAVFKVHNKQCLRIGKKWKKSRIEPFIIFYFQYGKYVHVSCKCINIRIKHDDAATRARFILTRLCASVPLTQYELVLLNICKHQYHLNALCVPSIRARHWISAQITFSVCYSNCVLLCDLCKNVTNLIVATRRSALFLTIVFSSSQTTCSSSVEQIATFQINSSAIPD